LPFLVRRTGPYRRYGGRTARTRQERTSRDLELGAFPTPGDAKAPTASYITLHISDLLEGPCPYVSSCLYEQHDLALTHCFASANTVSSQRAQNALLQQWYVQDMSEINTKLSIPHPYQRITRLTVLIA